MYTIDYTPYKLLDWVNKVILNKFLEKLSRNPKAIHLLEQNPDKINWKGLSLNPKAIHLLEHNIDKIVWSKLCQNKNLNAINPI